LLNFNLNFEDLNRALLYVVAYCVTGENVSIFKSVPTLSQSTASASDLLGLFAANKQRSCSYVTARPRELPTRPHESLSCRLSVIEISCQTNRARPRPSRLISTCHRPPGCHNNTIAAAAAAAESVDSVDVHARNDAGPSPEERLRDVNPCSRYSRDLG